MVQVVGVGLQPRPGVVHRLLDRTAAQSGGERTAHVGREEAVFHVPGRDPAGEGLPAVDAVLLDERRLD